MIKIIIELNYLTQQEVDFAIKKFGKKIFNQTIEDYIQGQIENLGYYGEEYKDE